MGIRVQAQAEVQIIIAADTGKDLETLAEGLSQMKEMSEKFSGEMSGSSKEAVCKTADALLEAIFVKKDTPQAPPKEEDE